MKRKRLNFLGVLSLLAPLIGFGQVEADPVTVPIMFQGTFEPMTSGTGDLVVEVQASFPAARAGNIHPDVVTEFGHAYARPGKTFPVELQTSGLKSVQVKISAPAGYRVYIDEVERDVYTWSNNGTLLDPRRTFMLRLENPGTLNVGVASSLRPGRVRWSVGLGNLKNGQPAGSLQISEPEISQLVYQPEGLFYDRDSGGTNNGRSVSAGEVIVVKESGSVRQVYAAAVLADVIRRDDVGYWIKLYSRSQVSDPNGTGTFTVSGTPIQEFLIENPSPATMDKLRITRTTNQNGQLVMWTEMAKSTPAAGQTVWLVQDWVEKTTGALTVDSPIRHKWTIEDEGRIELLEVVDQNGTVASKTMRYYQDYWFGVEGARELWKEIEGYGTSTAVEKVYTYGQEIGHGSWHKVTRVVSTDGSWIAYSYYDDFARMGRLKEVRRPFKNLPAVDPGSYMNQGESTTYSYEYTDSFGCQRMPTRIETKLDGKVVARSDFSYNSETITDASRTYSGTNGIMPIVVATRKDYSSDTQWTTTIIKTYREDADPQYKFFPGLIRSIERPDRTMTVKLYSPATLTNGILTLSATGSSMATITVQGTSDTTIGISPSSSYSGLQTIPTGFRVVAGKSTETRAVLDATGQPLLSRISAYIDTWRMLAEDETAYLDCFGPSTVTHRTPETSWTVTTNTWSKGRLSASVESTGIKETFTYDSVGRLDTTTREGAVSGAVTIAAQTTTKTYDAMRRSLTTTRSAGGESIVESSSYDQAGRVLSESVPGQSGPIVTSYSYNVASRTKTATTPDGTRTETLFADGRLASVTGTAVVPQYFEYTIPADGTTHIVRRTGSSNDIRRTEVVTDWLGRIIEQRSPGFSGAADIVETRSYDPIRGQVTAMGASGGFADTRFEYNSLGELTRSGVDVTGGGLANLSTDRINETDTTIESYDGAYWRVSRNWKFFTDDVDEKKLISVTRERLTGMSSSVRGEVRSWDADGNETRSFVTITPASKTVVSSTTAPGQVNTAAETSLNGYKIASVGFDGLTYRWEYDALGRLSKVIDPRTGSAASGTVTYHPGTELPYLRRDARDQIVERLWYDGMGRVAKRIDGVGNTVRSAYNSLGLIQYLWGSGASPVSYLYNGYGELNKQRTYQDASLNWDADSWPGTTAVANETEWQYDAGTGLLQKKYDPLRRYVEYTYTARNELYKRYWTRTSGGAQITATYDYAAPTGELTSISYNDGTAGVQYSYTRAGQLDWVSDASGLHDFIYDATSPWRVSQEATGRFYAYRRISYTYETTTSTDLGSGGYTGHILGGVNGRSAGFKLGFDGALAAEMELSVGFDNADRIAGYKAIRTNGANTRQFILGYQPNSSLLKSVSVAGSSFYVERGFEPNRNLMTSLESKWNGTAVSRFDYVYDDAGRRRSLVRSGSAYADYGDSTHDIFGYNSRGELTSAITYLGSNSTSVTTPLPARMHQFDYDAAGNRKWSDSSGITGLRDDYNPNELNQYGSRENNTLSVAGTAETNTKVAVVADQATLAGRAGRYWGNNVTLSNSTRPAANAISIYAGKVGTAGGSDILKKDVRTGYIAAANQVLSYDEDGNLTSDGVWAYTWDAENRLTRMTTTEAAAVGGYPRRRIEFRYDYLDRRVQKFVLNDATDELLSATRFLYEGSRLVAEFQFESGTFVLRRTYTWGASVMGGTDGVGALAQIVDHVTGQCLLPTYDGSGNIATLVNADSGSIEAVYEYAPFGALLRCEGSYAKENPFRFSTRYYDSETELYAYHRRYYSPNSGRWLSRDPIDEAGGTNLYRFCENDPINRWDVRGEGSDSDADVVRMARMHIIGSRIQDLTTNAYSGGWNIDGYVTSSGFDIRPGETADMFTVHGPMLRPGNRFKNKNGTGPTYVVTSSGGVDRDGTQIWNVLTEDEFLRAQAKEFAEKVIKEQVAQENVSMGKAVEKSIVPNSEGRSRIGGWVRFGIGVLQATIQDHDPNPFAGGPPETGDVDERNGRMVGHAANILIGVGEIQFGGTVAAGSGVLEVGSGGIATPVAVPAAIGGTIVAADGANATYNGAMNLIRMNIEGGGLSRGGAPNVNPVENVRPPNLAPPDAGRNGALRAALRRNGVPTSQQPTRVLPNVDRRGNPQPGRIYEYDVPAPGGGTRTVRIRDDAGGHNFGPKDPQNRGPHFNDEAGNHYDYRP